MNNDTNESDLDDFTDDFFVQSLNEEVVLEFNLTWSEILLVMTAGAVTGLVLGIPLAVFLHPASILLVVVLPIAFLFMSGHFVKAYRNRHPRGFLKHKIFRFFKKYPYEYDGFMDLGRTRRWRK